MLAGGVERGEQAGQRVGGDAGAGVADGKPVFAAVGAAFQLDQPRAVGPGQGVGGVLHQVVQDLFQRHAVTQRPRAGAGVVPDQADALPGQFGLAQEEQRRHQRVRVQRFAPRG
ncbi:hypothetical protein D3C71_1841480 [compost metagenome]